MYKIVFSDIDGTLLNSAHAVTPATRKSILSLLDNGIKFVLVSARSPSGIYPIMRKNDFHCPIITYSGALILDENRNVIHQNGMDISKAKEIIEFIESEKFPLTWCIYSMDEWIVKDRTDPRIVREETIVEAQAKEGTIFSVAGNEKIHKILCICEPDKTVAIERRIKDRFPEVNAVKSSEILLEIMSKGVNKAESVNIYCNYLNINPKDTIALGDNYNDVEMLSAVGCGVVMGNAPTAIKQQFSFITGDNDHDGIATALNQIMNEK